MLKQLKNLRKIDWLYVFIAFALIFGNCWFELEIFDYMAEITTMISSNLSTISEVLIKGAWMLLFAILSMALLLISKYFVAKVAAGLSSTLREKVYDKVINFSSGEIKHFSTPSLITRSTNDITQVQMVIAHGMQILFKAPIMAVLAVCKIVSSNIAWTIATVGAVGIIVVTIFIIVIVAMPKFKKMQILTDNLNKVTREGLTGSRVVRAFNAEDYQEAKFKTANDDITNTHLFINKWLSLMDPTMNFIMSALPLSIYIIGAILIAGAGFFEKGVLLGQMMTFSGYAIQVVMSFVMIIMISIMIPRALVSAKRINEVLDTKNSVADGDGISEPIKEGEVQFVNVGFKYPDAEEYVLHDISFKAKKGDVVAFIGSTGSGKSTLINLVPRLYDATEGQVIVDGVNVKDYTIEQLNDKIGYISQKAILFSGTVRENITFGEKKGLKPTDEEIKEAIEISQSGFVYNLEGGLDARIDQGGKNVSGGQKQRISIARALARKPEILIFDDSFSALDYKTDRALRLALKEKSGDTTCLIVAQRIGTIKDADKIIVLDKGAIVGEGTHKELMKNCSVYKEIALSQLSKEELKNA